MANNFLFDALKEIKEQEQEEKKPPKIIYLDEKDRKIKEKPLKDSAGSLFYNPIRKFTIISLITN